jgi:hypothetical protein
VACLGSTALLPSEQEAGGLRLFAYAPPAPPHSRSSGNQRPLSRTDENSRSWPAWAQPLPCLRSDPSGLRRVETFWNSFSRGLTTAGLQSVPAFLLASASVGPRSSGKVRSEPRQALLSSQRMNGMLRFHLRTQRRKTHQPASADLLAEEGIAVWR